MRNQDIADIFNNIATILDIKDENIFKIKAYRKAAENIEALGEDIADIKSENRLSEIPGIGEALREKIIEYLDTGKISAYEKLLTEIPEGLLSIVNVPSVGPKKARLFYDQLNIKSVAELEKAATSGKLLGLPGIQEKAIENILRGIRLVKEGQERMNIGWADEIAQKIIAKLKMLP